MEFFKANVMISYNIWEFPVFWLVNTVVIWLKMRPWEISGLMTPHNRMGFVLNSLGVILHEIWDKIGEKSHLASLFGN